jgi:hypothetical protein
VGEAESDAEDKSHLIYEAAAKELTARTYPVGGNRESVWIGPARRHGLSLRASAADSYSIDWAMLPVSDEVAAGVEA